MSALPGLSGAELERMLTLGGGDGQDSTRLDGLVWHALIHEMRHTAQMAMLLRQADVKPPFLDLLNDLPVTRA